MFGIRCVSLRDIHRLQFEYGSSNISFEKLDISLFDIKIEIISVMHTKEN